MKRRQLRLKWILAIALLVVWAPRLEAQTSFSSGSTGSLGAFAPAANTTVTLPPDGVLNYTTINIPAGVTVAFAPNAANTPVTMLATGDVLIAGTVQVNGLNGLTGTIDPAGPVQNLGGRGGPGGFTGGAGGTRGLTNNVGRSGAGPGGGQPAVFQNGGFYGAPTTFVSLLPLFGGSGGGGENSGLSASGPYTGASGGGGGGAIVIASTTKIVVSGSILANGGSSGGAIFICGTFGYSGPGSGGAIRLVAPQITNTGTIQAKYGTSLSCSNPPPNGTNNGAGQIRLEALVFGTVAITDPLASVVTALGPVTANSIPALVNLPTLAFTSIGGQAPLTSAGSYTSADVTLPAGTTNPVPVILTATNTPVPTSYTVKLIPQSGTATVQTVASSGSFSLSTATANVTLPNGVISGLQAWAGFTLTASLAPIIDGEPADQVMLAAGYGEPSSMTLVTKSGREIPVSELSLEDQVKLSRAFEAIRDAQ